MADATAPPPPTESAPAEVVASNGSATVAPKKVVLPRDDIAIFKARIVEFLRTSDLETTTTRTVRNHLEATFEYNFESAEDREILRKEVSNALASLDESEKQPEPEAKEANEKKPAPAKRKEEPSDHSTDDESPPPSKKPKSAPVKKEKSPKAPAPSKPKARSPSPSSRRNRMAPESESRTSHALTLSEPLEEVVGVKYETRKNTIRLLLEYIRANDLVNPDKKSEFLCDEKLKALFGVDKITEAQINKKISDHMVDPRAPKKKKKAKKVKAENGDGDGDNDEDDDTGKKKQRQGGFHKLMRLSGALADFIGEDTMSRPQVVKRINAYVKEHKLQDPKDGRNILFDQKLQDVFGTKKTTFFKINKLLSNHLAPADTQ